MNTPVYNYHQKTNRKHHCSIFLTIAATVGLL